MTKQSHMRCHEATRYLSAFADGELAEPLRSLVGAHVADCQRCAAEVARVRQTDVLLRAIPRTAPSPRVFHDVLDAIQAEADP